MSTQLLTDHQALCLFFTEDVYLLKDEQALHIADQPDANGAPESVLPSAETVAAPGVSFTYLGKNQKRILILVNDPGHKVSTEKGSELLRNIVKAINLSANDFALVNYAQHPAASYHQLKSFFLPALTFCFGASAADLQLQEQPLNQIHILEDARIIFCDNLDRLSDDQQSKKMLWASLKKLDL